MDWAKGLIDKCGSTEAAIIIVSVFAMYLMFRLLVWAFKTIEKFAESEAETAKTLASLKTFIETVIPLIRDRENDQ